MKRIKLAFLFSGLLTGFSGMVQAQTPSCPDAPNRITVRVNADVKYDAASGLYTYAYTVSNDAASAQEVDRILLDFVPPISNIISPRGWSSDEEYFVRTRSIMGWDAMELADPDSAPNNASLSSIVQIKPGATLDGFSFRSPKPPGPVKYYVTGWVTFGVSTGATMAEAELAAEEMEEACQHLQLPLLDLALVGSTLGPSDVIPVTIDIKPGSDPNAINPRNQGVVPVAILGSITFDVQQVDVASVRFGPGQAAPNKGKGHYEDLNNDGIMDIVFQFPTQEIGLRCQDTALFLTGKLRDGRAIAGADSVVTAGCH